MVLGCEGPEGLQDVIRVDEIRGWGAGTAPPSALVIIRRHFLDMISEHMTSEEVEDEEHAKYCLKWSAGSPVSGKTKFH